MKYFIQIILIIIGCIGTYITLTGIPSPENTLGVIIGLTAFGIVFFWIVIDLADELIKNRNRNKL